MQPTPVFSPGKSNGQRSLVGCSPWGHRELDTTECLSVHIKLSVCMCVCVCVYVCLQAYFIHMLAVVVSIKSTLIVNMQPQGNSYLKPSNQKPTSRECKMVQPL